MGISLQIKTKMSDISQRSQIANAIIAFVENTMTGHESGLYKLFHRKK